MTTIFPAAFVCPMIVTCPLFQCLTLCFMLVPGRIGQWCMQLKVLVLGSASGVAGDRHLLLT